MTGVIIMRGRRTQKAARVDGSLVEGMRHPRAGPGSFYAAPNPTAMAQSASSGMVIIKINKTTTTGILSPP